MIMYIGRNPEREPPTITSKPAEALDMEYVARYGEVARQAIEACYGDISKQVNEVFSEVGARVQRGISYAGEDPTTLYIPPEKSSHPDYPA